jgi:hypothetical protein
MIATLLEADPSTRDRWPPSPFLSFYRLWNSLQKQAWVALHFHEAPGEARGGNFGLLPRLGPIVRFTAFLFFIILGAGVPGIGATTFYDFPIII